MYRWINTKMCYALVKLVGLEEDRNEVTKLIQSIKITQKNLSTKANGYVDAQLNELSSVLRMIEEQIASIENLAGIKHEHWWKCIF